MVRTNSPELTAVVVSFIVVGNIILWMILIAALGLGAMHLNTCPLQPYIPIYLIVTGVLSMASLLLIYIRTAMIDESLLRFMCSLCLYLIIIFNFCWFISGAVWVYSTHYPNYNPTSGEQYCQKTVYLFAFWFTNLSWVAVGLMLLCGGYLLLYICVRLAFRGHHLFPSNQKTYETEGEA
ncbi:transmembrane protein 272-like [Osmerus eperlanus]|uniref:transmembrane protein 272-like n=1 Tax=Osmerus eperlanus TaxID=29151 RepID=UPI002E12187C